jgi:hypothetical protein
MSGARTTVAAAQSREERIAARGRNLWGRYRISTDMWLTQFRVQGGLCMWCRRPGNDLGVDSRPRRGRKAQVPMVPDHQHFPPYRWRGLGHARCNGIAGLIEAALADPPTSWPGGVDHCIPAYLALQLNRAAERDRERKRDRRRGIPPARSREVPGERTTYQHADPDADRPPDGARLVPADMGPVLAALAELQDLEPREGVTGSTSRR